MTNMDKIVKIYLQIDRIAVKGAINYLEYYRYIDDCINNGNYDNLLQCLFLYYGVDLREIEVANDLKKYWNVILSITLKSFDKKLKKLYTNKKVYQLGRNIYDDSNDNGILYGEIIETEVYTPEQKYYLKNKEYAKITKTLTSNLVVNRVDGEVLILDDYNDNTSYDANLYNKYAQAITFLLSYIPPPITDLPTFYQSLYNQDTNTTKFYSVDTLGNLTLLNLFSDDLNGSTFVANDDDDLTYFINDDLNGNVIFGILNNNGSIDSIPLNLNTLIGSGISFYYDGNDSFIYCAGGLFSNNDIQTTFRIHINGSVDIININDRSDTDINITSLFKSSNINYTLSVLLTNNAVNSLNITDNIGDIPSEDDINVLTTINNVPLDMYKLLFVPSSVVVSDRVYCLYALVNKENNDQVLCIAQLNLETYEGEWISTFNITLSNNDRPLQILANLNR